VREIWAECTFALYSSLPRSGLPGLLLLLLLLLLYEVVSIRQELQLHCSFSCAAVLVRRPPAVLVRRPLALALTLAPACCPPQGNAADMAARHPPGPGAASLGAASSWISAIESASPGSAKPAAGVWAAGADSIAESSSDSIADALRQRHRDAIAAVHPWFASVMSPSYFHTVDPQVQMRHIESLAYCYSMGLQPELSYHENGELTLIRPGGGDGLSRTWAAGDPSLFAVLSQIPEGQQLGAMRKYTSLDGTVTIINAKFDESARFTGAAGQEADMQAMLHSFTELVRSGEADWSPPACAPSEPEALAEALSAESLDGFLRQCASPYVVRHRNPGRLLEQMMYYKSVAGSDDTEVDVSAWLPESEEDKCAFEGLSDRWMVTIASGNSQPQLQMPKLANYLGSQGLSIRRVFLDLMGECSNVGLGCGCCRL